MQDVVLHQFVVLSGVIMIEYGFRLFVLKEFQRNECKAFARHKDIDTAERILQPVRFAESLFQVGSEDRESSTPCSWKENLPSPSGLNIEKKIHPYSDGWIRYIVPIY